MGGELSRWVVSAYRLPGSALTLRPGLGARPGGGGSPGRGSRFEPWQVSRGETASSRGLRWGEGVWAPPPRDAFPHRLLLPLVGPAGQQGHGWLRMHPTLAPRPSQQPPWVHFWHTSIHFCLSRRSPAPGPFEVCQRSESKCAGVTCRAEAARRAIGRAATPAVRPSTQGWKWSPQARRTTLRYRVAHRVPGRVDTAALHAPSEFAAHRRTAFACAVHHLSLHARALHLVVTLLGRAGDRHPGPRRRHRLAAAVLRRVLRALRVVMTMGWHCCRRAACASGCCASVTPDSPRHSSSRRPSSR